MYSRSDQWESATYGILHNAIENVRREKCDWWGWWSVAFITEANIMHIYKQRSNNSTKYKLSGLTLLTLSWRYLLVRKLKEVIFLFFIERRDDRLTGTATSRLESHCTSGHMSRIYSQWKLNHDWDWFQEVVGKYSSMPDLKVIVVIMSRVALWNKK